MNNKTGEKASQRLH